MDEYLESIQSMESAGTSVQEQDVPDSTPILEMSGDAPKLGSLSHKCINSVLFLWITAENGLTLHHPVIRLNTVLR